MSNTKYNKQEVLNFLADILHDEQKVDAFGNALNDLKSLYNDFIDNFLLPSAFPTKYNVQQNADIFFNQLELLSLFPNIMNTSLYCLVGFSKKDRTDFFQQNLQEVPDIIQLNTEVPTLFSSNNSSVCFVSWHGQKQELELGNRAVSYFFNTLFNQHFELKNLYSFLNIPSQNLDPLRVIVDFPEFALPDSQFLTPVITLAETVVFAPVNNRNRQLVTNAQNILKDISHEVDLFLLRKDDKISPKFSNIIKTYYLQVKDINILEKRSCINVKSLPYSLVSSLFTFSTWIAQETTFLSQRESDLTAGLVMLHENDEHIATSLKEIREELNTELKKLEAEKRLVDQRLNDIWKKANFLVDILSSMISEETTSLKLADCLTPRYINRFYCPQEECFMQLYYSGQSQRLHDLLSAMENSGYPHSNVLKLYLADLKGVPLPKNSLNYLAKNGKKNLFLLKSVIHFREDLNIDDLEAGELTQFIRLQTADEFFLHGLWLLENTDQREQALRELRESLARGNKKAAQILLIQSQNDNKSIRFLAKHHVAQANYICGSRLIRSNDEQIIRNGWKELKIAAAQGHLSAMELLAEHEYRVLVDMRSVQRRGDKLSNDEQKRSNRAKNNAKLLYEQLICKNSANSKSIANYGDILHYEQDFLGALSVLQKCTDAKAQYICGRIYEFGDGVARDLASAKEFYQKSLAAGNKSASKRLQIVNQKILDDRKKKHSSTKQNYGIRTQSRTSSTTSSGWCFITTATCLALGRSDDCQMLTTFRQFRDNFIMKSSGGDDLIRYYYDIAPNIVRKINMSSNSEKVYFFIWTNFLKRIYSHILLGEKEIATQLYIKMVLKLQELFGFYSHNKTDVLFKFYNNSYE